MKACVQPDCVSDIGGLWNCLPAPEYIIGMVAYGKFLICQTRDLHALSPDTESWVHVGRLGSGRLITLCTGELAELTRGYWSLDVKLLSVKGIRAHGKCSN